ncbi:MAG: hypothetical protein WCT39_02615 [Candidatus Margulisiibacteriota bacterium]
MNPVKRLKIENLKEILAEIELCGNFDCLRAVEDKMIQEIAELAMAGTAAAKAKLKELEKVVNDELDYKPRRNFLLSVLKNSLSGAISAAKFSLF